MYREGTKNYYYVNSSETVWKQLLGLMENIYGIIQEVSNELCSKGEEEIIILNKISKFYYLKRSVRTLWIF